MINKQVKEIIDIPISLQDEEEHTKTIKTQKKTITSIYF